jgi:hypothetical protein
MAEIVFMVRQRSLIRTREGSRGVRDPRPKNAITGTRVGGVARVSPARPPPHHRPKPAAMSRIPPPSSSRSRPTLVTPSSRGSTTSTTRAPSAPSTPTRVGTAPRSATTARGPAPSRLAPSTSTNGRRSGTVSPSKPGARSPLKSPSKPLPELEPEPPRSPAKLSVREQIALRRAEAKKAAGSGRVFDGEPGPDSVPGPAPVEEEEDALGRLPLREVIERAKGSGMFLSPIFERHV